MQLIDQLITQHPKQKPKKNLKSLDRHFYHQWKQELNRAMKSLDKIKLKPDSESNMTIWLDDFVTQSYAESKSKSDSDLTINIC